MDILKKKKKRERESFIMHVDSKWATVTLKNALIFRVTSSG